MNDWKDRLNVVYSTNPNFKYDTDKEEEQDTLPKEKQQLRIQLDKRNRKGKAVTLITGFVGTGEDLEELGKFLKVKCGVGYVVDKNFNIKYKKRKQAQNYTDKKAKEIRPLGF